MADCAQGALVVRRVVVDPREVVFLKGILEASCGLGILLAEQGGELALVTPSSREVELDELIDDLAGEISLRRRSHGMRDGGMDGAGEVPFG